MNQAPMEKVMSLESARQKVPSTMAEAMTPMPKRSRKEGLETNPLMMRRRVFSLVDCSPPLVLVLKFCSGMCLPFWFVWFSLHLRCRTKIILQLWKGNARISVLENGFFVLPV